MRLQRARSAETGAASFDHLVSADRLHRASGNASASGARRITDEMFMSTARKLASLVSAADLEQGSLYDLAIEGSLPKKAKALHGISQPGGQHNQSRPSA
jgi:hypothetical protein